MVIWSLPLGIGDPRSTTLRRYWPFRVSWLLERRLSTVSANELSGWFVSETIKLFIFPLVLLHLRENIQVSLPLYFPQKMILKWRILHLLDKSITLIGCLVLSHGHNLLWYFCFRFGMMTCCWLSSPEERPTFIQLLACLQDFSTALNRFI